MLHLKSVPIQEQLSVSRDAAPPSGSPSLWFSTTTTALCFFSPPFREQRSRWWQESGCRDHAEVFCSNFSNSHLLGGISFRWSWDSDYWSHGLLRCYCLAIGMNSYKVCCISMSSHPMLFVIIYCLEGERRLHGSLLWPQTTLKFRNHEIGKMLLPMNSISDL